MRRDYFTLDVHNVDRVDANGDPEKPTLIVDFHGPADLLRERLTGSDGRSLTAAETDVAYRLQDSVTDPDAAGVLGVTDRITGDFVLELNAEAETVLRFVRAAREYGADAGDSEGRYRIEIREDGDPVVTYEKGTLLIYDVDGNLLRSRSLIPSGVEL